MLDKNSLEKIGINEKWLEPLKTIAGVYVDEDKITLAMFLAQCSYESNNFTRLEESFKYTPERLFSVFPSRVRNIETARKLCKEGGISIANFLYNGRMNNIIDSSDGWKYRGRGIIQLTGRYNYRKYGLILNLDLENNPDLALELNNACLIAGAYWQTIRGNELSRENKFKEITRRINGGYNGLEYREKLYKKYLAVLNDERD